MVADLIVVGEANRGAALNGLCMGQELLVALVDLALRARVVIGATAQSRGLDIGDGIAERFSVRAVD